MFIGRVEKRRTIDYIGWCSNGKSLLHEVFIDLMSNKNKYFINMIRNHKMLNIFNAIIVRKDGINDKIDIVGLIFNYYI